MTAYLIAHIEIHDEKAYEEYRRKVPAIIAAHGGRYLVRAGRCEVLEGDWRPHRGVVIEFPSVDAALGWYHSDDYQELAKIRWSASTANFVVVEGV